MDEWISAKDAFAAVRQGGVSDAESAIINRAEVGLIRAMAKRLVGPNGAKDDQLIMPEFWQVDDSLAMDFDWQSGDFANSIRLRSVPGDGRPGSYGNVAIRAFGVMFSRNEVMEIAPAKPGPAEREDKPALSNRAVGGRPPASWWPSFAEELACYIHENGVPEGKGSQGQGVVINAVFSRLTEAGKEEPSRTAVQPVVSAILKRIRSAGN